MEILAPEGEGMEIMPPEPIAKTTPRQEQMTAVELVRSYYDIPKTSKELWEEQKQREVHAAVQLVDEDEPAAVAALESTLLRDKDQNSTDAKLALANETRAIDGGETFSPQSWHERRAQIIEHVRTSLLGSYDVGADLARGASASAALTVGTEALEQVLLPGAAHRFNLAMSEVFPTWTKGHWLNTQGGIEAAQDWLTDPARTDDEINQTLANLKSAYEQHSGLMTEGGTEYDTMVQTFLTNIDGNEPKMAKMNTIINALDYLGLVPLAKLAAKGAQTAQIARLAHGENTLARIGMIQGSSVHAAARSPTGAAAVAKAMEAGNGRADMQRSGADVAGHIDSTGVPRTPAARDVMGNNLNPNDIVPMETIYFTRQEDAIRQRNLSVLPGAGFKNHVVTELDNGDLVVNQRYGTLKGLPYKTEQSARQGAKAAGLDPATTKIIPVDGGGFHFERSGTLRRKLNDVGEWSPEWVTGHDVLGKSGAFSKQVNAAGDAASLRTEAETITQNKLIEPYMRLTGKRAEDVNAYLLTRDGLGFEDNAALAARGLDDGQQQAIRAVEKVADRDYVIMNARAEQALDAEGYIHAFKLSDDAAVAPSPAKVVASNPGHAVLDLNRKTPRQVGTSEKGTFYQFFEPVRGPDGSTYTHGFASASGKAKPTPRSGAVLPKRPGYVRRINTSTHYVTREVTRMINGKPVVVTEIEGAANSAAGAKRIAQALNDDKGVTTYSWKEATEWSQNVNNTALLEDGSDAAHRILSHRKELEIQNLEGGMANIMSVSDSISRMIRTSATQAGVGVWADVSLARLRKKFPNTDFNLAKKQIVWGDKVEPDVAAKAQQYFNHIRRTMGLDDPVVAAGQRKALADMVLNTGLPGAKWVAKELSGNGGKLVASAKTLTSAGMLILNPIRQAVMNMTMIPTYLGIEGAGRYLVSGGVFQDSAILAAHMMGDAQAARAAGKAVGRDAEYVEQLIADYQRSKLDASADAHIFMMDTLSENRVAARNIVMRSAADVLNVASKIGMKAGIKTDKRVAFLLSRERWKAIHGDYPTTSREFAEMVSFAETDLMLAQGRSDVLALQKGSFSFLFQFMSHQLKYTQRIAAQANAFLPPSVRNSVRAGDLSHAELRRMALINLATFGTAGYGITNAALHIGDKLGIDMPEWAAEMVDEGIAGTLVEGMFRLLDHETSDPTEKTRLSFSKTFSPSGFLVAQTGSLIEATRAFFTGSMMDDLNAPPSLSLVYGLAEAAQLGLTLGFHPAVGADQALEVSLERAARMFPIVNNTVKALQTLNTGYATDKNGRLVIPLNTGAAVARGIAGIQTEQEQGYRELLELKYGTGYADADEATVIHAIRQQAEADWAVIEPVLLNEAEGVRLANFEDMMTALVPARRQGLKHEFYRYEADMRERVAKLLSDDPKAAAIIDKMVNDLRFRKVAPEQSWLDKLKTSPDFPGKDKLTVYLEGLLDSGAGIELDL